MSNELQAPGGAPDYQNLLEQVSDTYTQGRVRAVQAVNAQITETYWQVGRHIVESEQAGNILAEYSKALLVNLSTDLGLRHGKGFSRSNLTYMRLLYLRYPICAKPSHILSLSHHLEPLKSVDLQHHDIGQMNHILPDRDAVRGELELSQSEAEQ